MKMSQEMIFPFFAPIILMLLGTGNYPCLRHSLWFFLPNKYTEKLSVEGFLVNGSRLKPYCNIFMSFLFVFR